ATGKTTVKLYNLSGQQILQEQFQAEKRLHQINTQQLESGMYLFVIENNGKKTTGKIVHE
ncbi:MAG: Secretion system C-terminal sorting domain, partial [Bacteroidota bacterium]